MKRIYIYLLIAHTALQLVTAIGIQFILDNFFPEILFDNYCIIPLFFFIIGFIPLSCFKFSPNSQPQKTVNIYMLLRVIKIFITLITILIYWIFDKDHMRNFVIIFALFYLINLIWETYIYMRMELLTKSKNDPQISSQKQNDQ